MRFPSSTFALFAVGLALVGCQQSTHDHSPAAQAAADFRQPMLHTQLLPAPTDGRAAASAPLAVQQAGDLQTQHLLEDDAEEQNQDLRRLWIEDMHRAADGVDWRAIERENADAAAERKRQARMSRGSSTGTWTEVGSRNQAGNTLVAVPTADLSTLYVGSALGGLFRGGFDGSNWTPISDQIYGGVSNLAVVPGTGGNPEILIRTSGASVLRSTDLGANWSTPGGLGNVVDTKRLLMLDDASNTLLLLARASGWRLFRSTDRGANFTEVRNMTGYKPDIWTPRDALGPIYMLDDNWLYQSNDKGSSFGLMGVAPFNASDVKLGGHESSGGTTFSVAASVNNVWELWRTEDAGVSWTHPNNLTGMWGAFSTSTQSDRLIAYGGVDMYISRDKGLTFDQVNSWAEYYGDPDGKLHADIMSISVLADATAAKAERWYINTHGGTYESVDRMRTVHNLTLSGLGVSQYYSSFTSRRDPNILSVGAQDQGYQYGVLGAPGGSGPYADFSQLISGDYGHLSSSDGSHDLVYSDYPGFILVQHGEVNPSLSTVGFPNGFAGQWLPYMVADPMDKRAFFLCGAKLWRYERQGGSNDWNPVQHTTQDFGGTLSSISFSPIDPNRAWCVTTNGNIWHSSDHGVTWTQALDSGPGAHYFYGTTIVPSSRNVDEVWIAGSGYSTAAVRFSDDGGVTWRNRSQNLPRTMAYGMCEGPDGSGSMYVAGQTGAFEWDPVAKQWNDILGADGPLTLYWSVESVPSSNTLRFATYGRGVWDYQPGTPGFFPYGELRGEPNTLQLRSSAQPLIGTTVNLTVSGGPPSATGFIVVCNAPDDTSYLGGTLLVDLATKTHQFQILTDASGNGNLALPIPNNTNLIGTERFLQAAVLDGSKPGGWAMSHGLRGLIGQ
jgi:photosystem II stability/assembly factor-like uncharacterized protein